MHYHKARGTLCDYVIPDVPTTCMCNLQRLFHNEPATHTHTHTLIWRLSKDTHSCSGKGCYLVCVFIHSKWNEWKNESEPFSTDTVPVSDPVPNLDPQKDKFPERCSFANSHLLANSPLPHYSNQPGRVKSNSKTHKASQPLHHTWRKALFILYHIHNLTKAPRLAGVTVIDRKGRRLGSWFEIVSFKLTIF